jgi:hypothetical protein
MVRLASVTFAVLVAAVPGAGWAAQPRYAGEWQTSATECGSTSAEAAVGRLSITRQWLTRFEFICPLKGIRRTGPGTWALRTRCDTAGERPSLTLTITVKGNRLTFSEPRFLGTDVYVRCR